MKPKMRKKAALLGKQQGMCYWCSKPIDLNATIDHLIPRSRGGTDVNENLALCCRSCNAAKSNMTPEEFVRHVLKVFKRFLLSDGFQTHRRNA